MEIIEFIGNLANILYNKFMPSELRIRRNIDFLQKHSSWFLDWLKDTTNQKRLAENSELRDYIGNLSRRKWDSSPKYQQEVRSFILGKE